ncbi:MAG: hypothetical protein VKJ46_11480 [Leptolyngbyaceae bacterium]|nr:hypothetical protein [Leptolyngbyaceae bacterium]
MNATDCEVAEFSTITDQNRSLAGMNGAIAVFRFKVNSVWLVLAEGMISFTAHFHFCASTLPFSLAP